MVKVRISNPKNFDEYIFYIKGLVDGHETELELNGQTIKEMYFQARKAFEEVSIPSAKTESLKNSIDDANSELEAKNTWITLDEVTKVIKIRPYQFYKLLVEYNVRYKQVHAKSRLYHKEDVIALIPKIKRA